MDDNKRNILKGIEWWLNIKTSEKFKNDQKSQYKNHLIPVLKIISLKFFAFDKYI